MKHILPHFVRVLSVLTILLVSGPFALAGEAEVVAVDVSSDGPGKFRFDVTIRHADTGWDHYVDKWDILDPNSGAILATRTLHHPHVNEQPFTRSLGGVAVPAEVGNVRVRAHDSVHGYGDEELSVVLPR